MPLITYGVGTIIPFGKKDDENRVLTYVNRTQRGAYVTFRILTKRFTNGENKFEVMDCKKYINSDPQNFVNTLKEGTVVFVSGTLEQYYDKAKNNTKYSINCYHVELCSSSKLESNIKKEPEVEPF